MVTHKDITKDQNDKLLHRLAKKECLKELAALRASNPDPPMVSELDLRQEDDGEECARPACVRRVDDLLAEVARLKSKVAELRGAGEEEAGPSTRQARRRPRLRAARPAPPP
uniref:Uncharacterized protein n=1 Tax=Knipowitschia caucasica TaxID=637954 RepID=A0AAV2LVG8_KNICA